MGTLLMKRKALSLHCHPGNAISEYGLMLTLVAGLVLVSLYGLRDSVAQLFTNASSKVVDYNVLAPVGIEKGTSVSKAMGGSNSGIDPLRGQSQSIQMGLGSDSTSTNVTSVDGDDITSVNTWGQAQTLEQLAQQEKNPAFAAYYAELAKLSYYLGAAEGRLDGLEPFMFAESVYEPDDALVDLMSLQAQLQDKLKNPPMGMTDSKAFKTALPLAMDVFNIADQYRNAFKSQIGPDGKVLPFRIDDNRERGPGTAFLIEHHIYAHDRPDYVGDYPGKGFIDYNWLKFQAKKIVTDTSTSAPLPKQTFADAIDLDSVEEANVSP